MMLNDALKTEPRLDKMFKNWGDRYDVDSVAIGEIEVDWLPCLYSKMLRYPFIILGTLLFTLGSLYFFACFASIVFAMLLYPPDVIVLFWKCVCVLPPSYAGSLMLYLGLKMFMRYEDGVLRLKREMERVTCCVSSTHYIVE